MTTLDLPSGYPDLILSWANSIMSEISPEEFGGDYWEVWTSPAGLHRYDINITTHANPDGDTARVVAYATYLEELDHDDLPIVESTDHSQFVFIGDVSVKQLEDSFDIRVCQDCYHAFHNGVDPEFVKDHTAKTDPLGLIGSDFGIYDKCDVDSGAGFSEFSKEVCDGCGSALAGCRFTLEVEKYI